MRALLGPLQSPLSVDWIPGHVLDTFVRMYSRFEQDRDLIPPGNLVDVHYESLVADPVGQLRQIYESLDLGGFATVEPAISQYARQMRGYRRNQHTLAPEQTERVRQRWAPYFERYGYADAEAVSATA